MDGHEWLEREVERLMELGQTWNNGRRPWGTLVVPPEGLELHQPLVLPLRCGVVGSHSYLRGTPAFRCMDGFQGGVAIEWEHSRSQGEFSHFLREVWIDCRGQASGIRLSGDQESRYEDMRITRVPNGYHGIQIDDLSHAARIVGAYVEGEDEVTPGATGILATSTKPIVCTMRECHLHNLQTGISRRRTYSSYDYGTAFENVAVPYILDQCNDTASLGVHFGVKCCSGGDAVLAAKCQQYWLRGTARKNAVPSIYADKGGWRGRRRLTSKANTNVPRPFTYAF